jgi:spore coat protein CotH
MIRMYIGGGRVVPRWWFFLVVASSSSLACSGDDTSDAPDPHDAGARDGGPSTLERDGGARDAGVQDAGPEPVGAVVINEIMYHPPADDETAQFVELYNVSGETVAVGGWRLRGFDFSFPPFDLEADRYVVIASDSAGYVGAYGRQPDFVASGGLRNSGEVLELIDGAGRRVDRVSYADTDPWPITPDGLGPALELVNPSLDNAAARAWRAGGPTPGERNSVYAEAAAPYVVVLEAPRAPEPNTALRVVATIDGATRAELAVKIGFAETTTVTMTSDAPGVFAAEIVGQPASTLVRYRVVAYGEGVGTWPRAGDTRTWDGTVVRDPSLSTALPVVQWFMAASDYRDARYGWFLDDLYPAVIYYDGVLFDGARVRIKGDSSRQFSKNNWKVKLPRGHLLDAPGLLPAPVDQFNLQSAYSDKSYLRDSLAYRTWRESGSPANAAFPVRVQQNGEFFGLFTFVEDMDRDYLRRHGLDPEGAWYEANSDGAALSFEEVSALYEKNTREREGHEDLFDFLQAINEPSGRKAFILDNVDVAAVINYMAVNVVIHNNDHLSKNYYLYRDTNGTQRWAIHPWDMDLTFGRNADPNVLDDTILADDDAITGLDPSVSPSHPLFGDRDHTKWDGFWNRIIDAMHADPDFRAMFYRRLRTLMDRFLADGVYDAWIDAYVPQVAPEAALDKERWKQWGLLLDHPAAVAQITEDFLPRRRAHLFTTHRVPGEVPAAQSASPRIVINELHYAPTEGSQLEFVELFNPSATEAVDLSGWRLAGVNAVLPAGAVLLPQAYLIVARDDRALRAARGGGRFAVATFPTPLDDSAATLELSDPDGRVVDRVAYSASAPWPDATGGASLELVDPDADNDVAGSWAVSRTPGGTPGTRNSVAN